MNNESWAQKERSAVHGRHDKQMINDLWTQRQLYRDWRTREVNEQRLIDTKAIVLRLTDNDSWTQKGNSAVFGRHDKQINNNSWTQRQQYSNEGHEKQMNNGLWTQRHQCNNEGHEKQMKISWTQSQRCSNEGLEKQMNNDPWTQKQQYSNEGHGKQTNNDTWTQKDNFLLVNVSLLCIVFCVL